MDKLWDYLYGRVYEYVLQRLWGRKTKLEYRSLLRPVRMAFSKHEHLKDYDPEELLKAVLENMEKSGLIERYDLGLPWETIRWIGMEYDGKDSIHPNRLIMF